MITAAAGVIGTGLGGFIGAVLRRDSTKVVSLLLAFAGGVMLSVVCFDLIPEAFRPEGAGADMPVLLVLAGVLLGYMVIYLLNAFIDERTNPEVQHIDAHHPQTADNLDELIHADHYNAHARDKSGSQHELFIAGVVMACAIALHNMPEGMVIGATYAADGGDITGGSGFIIAVVIGLHNIPEGMAVAVPLISGGTGRVRATLLTAACGLPTVLGAWLGFWLGDIGPLGLTMSLGFASGAMLYVVFGEIMPESYLIYRSKLPAFAVMVGLALGMFMIFF